MKKSILTIGTIAIVAAPIAIVVSCDQKTYGFATTEKMEEQKLKAIKLLENADQLWTEASTKYDNDEYEAAGRGHTLEFITTSANKFRDHVEEFNLAHEKIVTNANILKVFDTDEYFRTNLLNEITQKLALMNNISPKIAPEFMAYQDAKTKFIESKIDFMENKLALVKIPSGVTSLMSKTISIPLGAQSESEYINDCFGDWKKDVETLSNILTKYKNFGATILNVSEADIEEEWYSTKTMFEDKIPHINTKASWINIKITEKISDNDAKLRYLKDSDITQMTSIKNSFVTLLNKRKASVTSGAPAPDFSKYEEIISDALTKVSSSNDDTERNETIDNVLDSFQEFVSTSQYEIISTNEAFEFWNRIHNRFSQVASYLLRKDEANHKGMTSNDTWNKLEIKVNKLINDFESKYASRNAFIAIYIKKNANDQHEMNSIDKLLDKYTNSKVPGESFHSIISSAEFSKFS